MTILGADLSHFQTVTNWSQVRDARDFVVLKATESTNYTDPAFAARRKAARAVGLLVGMYHFARAGNAAVEAAYFLRAVGTLAPGEFLVLDWEVPAANPPAWCKQWLDTVYAATGARPLIYMNQTVAASFNWSTVAAGHALWLARYDNSTAQTAVAGWTLAMKQYSDKGTVPGVAGTCDVDVYYGSAAQLAAYGGEPIPAPTPASEDDDMPQFQNGCVMPGEAGCSIVLPPVGAFGRPAGIAGWGPAWLTIRADDFGSLTGPATARVAVQHGDGSWRALPGLPMDITLQPGSLGITVQLSAGDVGFVLTPTGEFPVGWCVEYAKP